MLNQSIDSLLEQQPLAAQVLSRHGVEFCCAGHIRLNDAIKKANANAAQIEKELSALGLQENARTDALSTSELVDYILARFHEKHREELPLLIQWAEKVERVHADSPHCPHGLATSLEETLNELTEHMMKEEQILFPMLRNGSATMAAMPMRVMRHEHVEHEARLQALEALTDHCTLPPGACRTWTNLYTGLAHLIAELRAHIKLENEVLFQKNGG